VEQGQEERGEGPEPQWPVSISVKAYASARDSTQRPLEDAAFDASPEVAQMFESEGRNAISTRADGGGEISKTDNLPTPRKQSKRKSGDFEADMREPKSRRKGPSKAPGKCPPASKGKSKGRDNTYSLQKSFQSFSDLTEISQKVLQPDEVHRILTQQSEEKYHHKLIF
jgi:hypothetical protein